MILAQIVALQSLFYIFLGLLLAALDRLFDVPLTFSQLFSAHAVRLTHASAWLVIVATLLNAGVVSVILMLIVERAKKILDFAFTAHTIHLVLCVCFYGFPSNWEWWVLSGVSLTLEAVVGEYLCMRQELREIRVSDFLSLRSAATAV